MTRRAMLWLVAALPVLTGCAGLSQELPVSTNVTGVPAHAQMPQSANSLPLGSAVSAPLFRNTLPPLTAGPDRVGVRPL